MTLALAYDIDALASQVAARGLAEAAAQPQFALHLDDRLRCPRGQPQGDCRLGRPAEAGRVGDYSASEDLRRRAVELLGGLGIVLRRELGDLKKLHDPKEADAVAKAQEKAQEVRRRVVQAGPVLDSGARGSTITFAKQKHGDVLLAWENDAFWAQREFADAKLEIVVPPVSILAEPPVAVVDKVVDEQRTRDVAEAYLKYLYSPEGQTIIAKNYYRPIDAKKTPAPWDKPLRLFTVDEAFGGWQRRRRNTSTTAGRSTRL